MRRFPHPDPADSTLRARLASMAGAAAAAQPGAHRWVGQVLAPANWKPGLAHCCAVARPALWPVSGWLAVSAAQRSGTHLPSTCMDCRRTLPPSLGQCLQVEELRV